MFPSWTEVTPGLWRKELEGAEKVYRDMSMAFQASGREQWRLYCQCEVRLKEGFADFDLPTALETSWKRLRFEFPALSVVPEGSGKVYMAPQSMQDVDDWACKTFIVEHYQSPESIIRAAAGPYDLPRLYYFPKSSKVLFLSSHWRIDGLGTCMLLDRLFEIVAMYQPSHIDSSFDLENEWKNLSPSLEDACGSLEPAKCSPDMDRYVRDAMETHHRVAVQGIGLPYKGSAETAPMDSYRQALTLSQASTKALVAACKARGVSVTAALHAALSETAFSLALPEDVIKDYSTVLSANLRDYLPQPYNGRTHACATYVTGLTPVVRRESNFMERASELTHYYKNWYSDMLVKTLRLRYLYHGQKLFAKAPTVANQATNTKLPSGITLSSLGVIDKHLRGKYAGPGGEVVVHIAGFQFGVSLVTRQMILYPWTFKGQLSLSINYNEAYYEEERAVDVLRKIVTVLEGNMGLKLDIVILR
ncbi:hypothetical protein TGAM01_v202360 [Trichoderma gamsii]|uniref:Uncharacterized protein n=1 Tax=Trichoderma gamsii TaxID=398673 RepID=A0A2P4ZW59_9HYPO|nr:hypothetical protein TGAM01_v202360 [Trichoderma gamsii]PON28513.1 hypothetical protein TGAM01_v202360 [Trichoderma gamsii]